MKHRLKNFIIANCRYGQKKYGVDTGGGKLFKAINKDYQYSIITDNEFENTSGYKKLFNLTKESIKNKSTPIILGGDHSISLSTAAASFEVFREDMTLIWVDAHTDINTPETSETSNLHGMPVASIFKLMDTMIETSYQPNFDQLIYFGVRDIDEPELKLLYKHDILYFDPKSIRKNGIDKTCEIINKKSNYNIHLSFDVDVLDPIIAPATGTPVNHGLYLNEIDIFINNLKVNKDIRVVDYVEYNPFIFDIDNQTFNNSVNIIKNIIDDNQIYKTDYAEFDPFLYEIKGESSPSKYDKKININDYYFM